MNSPANKEALKRWLDHAFGLSSLLALGLLIFSFGFTIDAETTLLIAHATEWVLGLFIIQEIVRVFNRHEKLLPHILSRKIEIIMALVAIQYFVYIDFIADVFQILSPGLGTEQISLLYLAVAQVFLVVVTGLGQARKYSWLKRIKLDPGQIIVLSFMTGATVGTCLLKLPNATHQSITWSDAAFTAISSICVTGLLPFNLAETFTPLGQFIICILIQIGGLGIMTLTMVFLTLFPGSLSVKEKIFLSEMVSENRLGEVGLILRRIVISTFVIEAIGTIYLYFTIRDFSDPFDAKTFYHCIFHAISAFCNAGMTLFSGSYDQMGANAFTGGLAVLIILGGIGFPVISELYSQLIFRISHRRARRPRLSVSTKLVLITSLVLWVGGAVLVGLLESHHSFDK